MATVPTITAVATPPRAAAIKVFLIMIFPFPLFSVVTWGQPYAERPSAPDNRLMMTWAEPFDHTLWTRCLLNCVYRLWLALSAARGRAAAGITVVIAPKIGVLWTVGIAPR